MLSAIYGQQIPTDAVRYVTNGNQLTYVAPGSSYEENPTIAAALQERSAEQQFGCFNFHPSTYEWPSRFAGGQFFSELKRAGDEGLDHFCVSMHAVQWAYDSGPVHKRSTPISLIPGMTSQELYLSCTQGVVELARKEIQEIVFLRNR